MSRKKFPLAIVIPVYNEEKSFPNTYAEIKKYVKSPHTISVVYDFDEDNTVPVVKRLQKSDPSLFLIKNNIGKGPLNALIEGFESVKNGPVLVVMADLSDDLRVVDKMLSLYNDGFDIICGSRYMKGGKQFGGPLIKRSLSRIAGISLFYLRRIPTHDITNNFKMYDKKVLSNLKIESKKGFSIAMEITVKSFLAGYKITELPATWRDRTEGEAKFNLWGWLPEYLRWYFYAFRFKEKSK
jgi:glycosyltransferase involved in cell wall biosynthesis